MASNKKLDTPAPEQQVNLQSIGAGHQQPQVNPVTGAQLRPTSSVVGWVDSAARAK